MAESTELTLSANDFNQAADSPAPVEQKSGFIGSMGGMDIVRQVALIIALTICVAIAILIIMWAREPDMRPLGTFETSELISLLKQALNTVNGLQKNNNELQRAVEMGDPQVSLAQAMIAGQKASIAFDATVQIRNRLVEAYKEVMAMPV